jgi:hypothetical protein
MTSFEGDIAFVFGRLPDSPAMRSRLSTRLSEMFDKYIGNGNSVEHMTMFAIPMEDRCLWITADSRYIEQLADKASERNAELLRRVGLC